MMVHQDALIQSFYAPLSSSLKDKKAVKPQIDSPTDGFTEDETDTLTRTTLHRWQPRAEYEDASIGSLNPGPGCVALTGRIVNFFNLPTQSKMPQAAKGCFKVVVKDDTGALVVKLWYAKIEYTLRLGQLVSIWTPHISTGESSSLVLQNASLVTSIFPERDNSCYFLVREDDDDGTLCKTPLGYGEGEQLKGLMTLKNFIEGGYDVLDGKILVCVKSTGGRRKLTTKKGLPAEKVEINVFDDTAEATLTLWGSLTGSTSAWTPSQTLLLISCPAFKDDRRPMLSITAGTHIEVDPVMQDAEWLRKYAQNLNKREHVNPLFPEDVFDIKTATTSKVRIKFMLADIDEFVRASPNEVYIGYLSVIILDLKINRLHQRNMLCCTECCGVPLYANATLATCKHCSNPTSLRLNPRLIGTLLDETGTISCGKLIWAPEAWEQLLGRTAEEMVAASVSLLRYLEQRMMYIRVTMMFGWNEDVGRLAVLRVSA